MNRVVVFVWILIGNVSASVGESSGWLSVPKSMSNDTVRRVWKSKWNALPVKSLCMRWVSARRLLWKALLI